MKRIAALVLFCSAAAILAQYSALQIPKSISYQGRVTQNGAAWNPVTGEGYFVFALVQNGSVLWNNYDGSSSPTDPASTSLGVDQMLSLPVSGGQFSVRLGATGTSGKNREIPATVFFDASNNSVRGQVKLAVWFSADANTFTRLSPDVDLASVPYALVAGIAETVQDRAIGTTKIADGAVNQINMAVNSVQTAQLQDAAITTAKVASSSITTQKLVAEVVQALVPPGTILSYGGAAAPAGYVLCDGTSYARTGTYASLFAAIGTSFGAPDGSSFNVPDLRGKFLRGMMPNLSRAASGSASGNAITVSEHPFNRTGMVVQVTGSLVTGLAPNTDYHIVNVGTNSVAFASSAANAAAGTRISLSGNASGMTITQAEDPDVTSRLAMANGGTGIGALVGSVQPDEFKSHTHGGTFQVTNFDGTDNGVEPNRVAAHNYNRITTAAGGNETRPKNAYVNYIIKL